MGNAYWEVGELMVPSLKSSDQTYGKEHESDTRNLYNITGGRTEQDRQVDRQAVDSGQQHWDR